MSRTFVIGCLILSGCFSTGDEGDAGEAAQPQTPKRIALINFTDYFATRVERAADDIAAKEESTTYQRNAIFWKLRAIPRCRRTLDLADDQAVFLDQWTLCSQMEAFFTDGPGKDLFGPSTAIAQEASQELEQAIRSKGHLFLDADRLAAADKSIAEFVKEYGVGSVAEPRTDEGSGLMADVLGKPLGVVTKPLSAVSPTKGLDTTADAVHRVAVTADHLQTEIRYLPDRLRWQTELLLLELQEDRAVVAALQSAESLSKSAASLAETAAALPAELQKEVAAVLTEVDEKQAGIQETLARVETVTTSADETVKDVTQLVAALTTLNESFQHTLGMLDKPSDAPPEPAGPPGPPFDINDYGATAKDLTTTATALTALLAQVQATTDIAEAGVGSTVDRLLVSVGLFLLFVAVLALGYRFVRKRMA